jgi:uncharacterized membrane protein
VDTLLSVTLKWIHLIATVAWIGGMFTNFFIYLPSMAKTLEPQVAGRLMGAVMKRFRVMVYASMAVFLLSGILLGQMDLNPGVSVTARNEVVNILIFKIPLFVLMVILAIVAFEVVAQRAARLAAEGPSPGLKKAQRTQKIMAVIGFLLGLIILVLSAAL